jgi:hypothetical protein
MINNLTHVNKIISEYINILKGLKNINFYNLIVIKFVSLNFKYIYSLFDVRFTVCIFSRVYIRKLLFGGVSVVLFYWCIVYLVIEFIIMNVDNIYMNVFAPYVSLKGAQLAQSLFIFPLYTNGMRRSNNIRLYYTNQKKLRKCPNKIVDAKAKKIGEFGEIQSYNVIFFLLNVSCLVFIGFLLYHFIIGLTVPGLYGFIISFIIFYILSQFILNKTKYSNNIFIRILQRFAILNIVVTVISIIYGVFLSPEIYCLGDNELEGQSTNDHSNVENYSKDNVKVDIKIKGVVEDGIKELYNDVKGILGGEKRSSKEGTRSNSSEFNSSDSNSGYSNNGKHNKSIYALLPFINGNLMSSVDSISSINKIILGVLTITITILYCLINIMGYFGCLYIIKHTELEKKYPKLKTIVKYYQNTSVVFLVIEIIFVISILLLVIGLCLHLLYISKDFS